MSTLAELGGWRAVLTTLTDHLDLSPAQAHAAMREILNGDATPAQIAGFVVALRVKGEAVAEVSGMVDAMLEACAPIEVPGGVDPIDIVGTGGAVARRSHALNVSTAASLVAAGAGARVLKHGNRKASSTSGSFDLLEALGVVAELDAAGVLRCLDACGAGFLFARSFHPAMRHAAPVRAELGVPTVFNFLGPLSNPARVKRQVIGVADPSILPTVIGVLQARGMTRALVVHGSDGIDELTLTGPSTMFELREGTVTESQVHPEALGLTVVAAEDLRGGDPSANAAIVRGILDGDSGPYRDIVLLNAAAGLVVAGLADDLVTGIEQARSSIDSGSAARVLALLVEASGG